MKRCSTCREVKPVADFSKNRAQPDGLHNECKACNAEYAARNSARIAAYARAWRARRKAAQPAA